MKSLNELVDLLKQKYNVSHLYVYEKGEDIKLDMIAVPKESRNQGIGSAVMEELCRYADQNNKRIILTVGQKDKNFGTTSAERLYKFYKQFGFIRNFGKNKDYTIMESMYRNPKYSIKENKNLSFKKYLTEMPLRNYQTIGNFDKNSSFRDPRDRMLIQHPKAIERVRKKFGSTEHDFDFYFVNSPKANKHTERGLVSIDWVKQNLGDDVYNAVAPNMDQDHIQVIFTNNKGSERKNMSAWIMAHRIGHALARQNGFRDSHSMYMQASNFLLRSVGEILSKYGVRDFPRSEDQMNSRYGYNSQSNNIRKNQLAMMYFFYQISTFRSAREHTVRDWFEILNELIAQYLTTGKIKFNQAPKSFSGGSGGSKQSYVAREDLEDINDYVQTLSRDLEFYINDILSSVSNGILIM